MDRWDWFWGVDERRTFVFLSLCFLAIFLWGAYD